MLLKSTKEVYVTPIIFWPLRMHWHPSCLVKEKGECMKQKPTPQVPMNRQKRRELSTKKSTVKAPVKKAPPKGR